MQGIFITFEGPEGAGKSTQIERLATRLKQDGHEVLVSREPGGAGAFGQGVRKILLEGGDVAPRAELFLFLADRAQHVATLLLPALEERTIVICDRYADSTDVYQGIARGFGIEETRELNRLATGGLQPDMTILLDLPASEGLQRIEHGDRLDREGLEFHERVRQGFLTIAEKNERFRVLDARCSPDDLAEDIHRLTMALLFAKGYNSPPEED